MNPEKLTGLKGDVPIVLSKWYDACKWILAKVDNFPKNQRFILGTRLADRSLGILETLVEAAYTHNDQKTQLLKTANRDLAVLRWLVRMAKDRHIITMKQYQYACGLLVDFLLFSDDKEQLRDWGNSIREKVNSLRLEIHPDKYRLLSCNLGVDFCGFVVFSNGRIKVRRTTARRFHKRFKSNLKAVNDRTGDIASLSQSVTAWVGHVKHAQSWNLRKAILCG